MWSDVYGRRLLVSDLIAVIWGAAGVHLVHTEGMTSSLARDPMSLRSLGVTFLLAAAWLVLLDWWGTRDGKVIGHGPEEYKRVVNASLAVFGALAIAAYLLNLNVPRSYLLIMMPAGLFALLIGRFLNRRWLHARRATGELMTDLIVVGNTRSATELIEDLRREKFAGYRVVGVCLSNAEAIAGLAEADSGGRPTLAGVPILGGLTDVPAAARAVGAHSVAVTATDAFGPTAVRRLGWELESCDVDLILAPALTNIAGPRIHTQPVAGLPLIHVERPTYRGANRILKKSFDIVGSALLLLLASPALLVLAATIKLTDGGSVFFRQERVGLNGKSFKMIKFRSMVPNAEALLPALQAQRSTQEHMGNTVMFKMADDPRITKVGRILRKYSLDELPQLFNVIKGEMSLVGPRPPLMSEVAKYGDDARRRLLVKPGMTGLWQVSGRSSLSWEETVRLDVYYVENWSIVSDLVILWKTAKAVSASSGAC